MNGLRISGITIAILMFLTALIIMNIRKKTESEQSTLMRIMTNYLQVISTTLALNSNSPDTITDMFVPANILGSSSEAFVSIDCFIKDSEMNAFAPNSIIFKVFLMLMLPIFMILTYIFVWVVLYFVANKYFFDIKRNIIVSIIVILFLLHPAVTRSSLFIFQCVQVDEDDFRSRSDLNMK